MASVRPLRQLSHSITQSLRYRLLAFLLVSLLVLMSVTLVIAKITADHEFGEVLDGQMVTTGRAIFSVIALELREGDSSRITPLLDEFVRHRQGIGDWIGENTDIEVYDNEFYFQLDDASGKTVFASQQPALVQAEFSSLGFFEVNSGENQWHLFGLQDAQTRYTFYTGQSQKLRHQLSEESVEYILLPFILVTLFILGAIWAGTRYGLRPLTQLTQELESRSPLMLEKIDTQDKATELRPLISALNNLLTRVRTSLAKERQFSMDVSHELRTPLAGITANLDAVRCLSVAPEQSQYLDNIQNCVDNSTEITEGLLLLSRIQSNDLETYFDTHSFDMNQLISREVNKRIALDPTAENRIQHNSKVQAPNIIFNGPENLVEIAIGNILDNALKYSTGHVELQVGTKLMTNKGYDESYIAIVVNDNGPGVPLEEQERVLERFYQINSHAAKGFGLGLALVAQIMSALGGSIQLSNRSPKGLSVCLIFPMK